MVCVFVGLFSCCFFLEKNTTPWRPTNIPLLSHVAELRCAGNKAKSRDYPGRFHRFGTYRVAAFISWLHPRISHVYIL